MLKKKLSLKNIILFSNLKNISCFFSYFMFKSYLFILNTNIPFLSYFSFFFFLKFYESNFIKFYYLNHLISKFFLHSSSFFSFKLTYKNILIKKICL